MSFTHDAEALPSPHRDPVIEANDVRKLPTRPSLYVITLCAGKVSCRTQVENRRDASPTWGDTRYPLCVLPTVIFIGVGSVMTSSYRSAHLRSNLCFQLKQNHRFLIDSLLGSINIKVDELLDRCKDGERGSRCIPISDSSTSH